MPRVTFQIYRGQDDYVYCIQNTAMAEGEFLTDVARLMRYVEYRFASLLKGASRHDMVAYRFLMFRPKSPLASSTPLGRFDRLAESPLILVIPQTGTTPIASLDFSGWKTESVPVIEASDLPLVTIPHVYLAGVGLDELDQANDMVLYRRNDFNKQWDEMQRHATTDTHPVLWIAGPTGVGKSAAAFAFACCAIDRSAFTVLWLHIGRCKQQLVCVQLVGDTKATCTIRLDHSRGITHLLQQEVLERLAFCGKKALVILDGYTADDAFLLSPLIYWRESDPIDRKLIGVASMLSVDSRLTRPDLSYHHAVLWISSWRLSEFVAAVKHDALLAVWCRKLDPQLTREIAVQESEARRAQAVKQKHTVAGGNARLMFSVSSSTAEVTLDAAMAALSDLEQFLTDAGRCIASTDAASQLLDVVYHDNNPVNYRVLSAYVRKYLYDQLEEAALIKFDELFGQR